MAEGTIEVNIRSGEYRPCLLDGKTPAIFHRWSEKAELCAESPLQGGHPAGQIKATLALLELESGEVIEVYPQRVKFLDTDPIMRETFIGASEETK